MNNCTFEKANSLSDSLVQTCHSDIQQKSHIKDQVNNSEMTYENIIHETDADNSLSENFQSSNEILPRNNDKFKLNAFDLAIDEASKF